MSIAQLSQNNPENNAASYIDSLYPADCTSKIFQIPQTKRICKITSTPAGGQVLTFIQQQGGTVENPDVLGWQTLGTLANASAVCRTQVTNININPSVGGAINFDTLQFDTSSGDISSGPTNFILGSGPPTTYSASVWTYVQRPAAASGNFILNISLILVDPTAGPLSTIIAQNSVYVAQSAGTVNFYINCTGSFQRTGAASSFLYALVSCNSISGTVPTLTILDSRIVISNSKI